MSAGVEIAVPTIDEVAAVRAVSPLAADLDLVCGPFAVPAGVAAATPTLELEESEPARVLREFLAENPWTGMGSVHPGGWVLLARDDHTMVFGQREGAVGLGTVVTLARSDGRFKAMHMGGWHLRPPEPDGQVEPIYAAERLDCSVTVTWDCGQDMAGVAHRRYARTELLEGPETVHFLLISRPNPDRPQPPSGFLEIGTGKPARATFHLRTPLADRVLVNDFRIPAAAV